MHQIILSLRRIPRRLNVPAVPLVKRDSPRILHQTLKRTCTGKRLLHLLQKHFPDAVALILRVNKEVVQKIIVRPDGGKAQAMAVLRGNPNHFVTGGRVKVFKLPV